MSLSIEQLRSPFTRSEALEWALLCMQSVGFETTGWQDGRIQKTIVLTISTVVSDISEVVKDLVEFGNNELASGDPLNEFSKSRFDNTKSPATSTTGPIVLASKAAIPYTVNPGEVIVATDSGVEFRNVDGGTIPAAGSTSLTFRARVAGAGGNVPAAAITRMISSLAGVLPQASGSPWYSVAGADEESDAKIRRRNSTKWSRINPLEWIGEAFENFALENGAAKVKIVANNPRGPATIDVYVGGETAVLGSSELAALQLAFHKKTFGTEANYPPTDPTSSVHVKSAVQLGLDFTARLYHDATTPSATVQARAREALIDYLRTVPIGGFDLSPGPTNIVPRGDLYEALEAVEGVRSVQIESGVENYFLLANALAVEGAWQLIPVPIKTGAVT